MSTIVTRTGKGSSLTYAEADANFTNLNTDKWQDSNIASTTTKATPVDADLAPIIDSAASNVRKVVSWANIKATLKTYFDTIYSTIALSGNNTWTGTQTFRDNKLEVTDDLDTTKKLTLQASGITTATTRTWTVGNYSGIPAVPTNEGTSNQLLTSAGAGNQPTWVTPSASTAIAGSIVQVVNTQTGAASTGTTVIPADDTIPQNTEGDQYMSLAITPTSATNKLKITVVVHGTEVANPANYWTAALFQDSTSNALAASSGYGFSAGGPSSCTFVHYMTAGTTSSTTFKVRAGCTAGTFAFNGDSSTGARLYGGVCASSITIEEIKV